jgi:hypothetical protein
MSLNIELLIIALINKKSTLHYIRAMIKLKNSMLCNKVPKSANFSRVRNTYNIKNKFWLTFDTQETRIRN